MRTITTTIYSAAELKAAHPKGYERALEWWRRVTYEDPAWQSEHRQSYEAARDALQSAIEAHDVPDAHCNPRRMMAWLENNVLAPLRIGWTGKRRAAVRQYGSGYWPGNVEPCPWTGFCVDEDLLDCMRKAARDGDSPRDILRAVEREAERLWENEVESQCTDEYFLDHAEANGYEFTESGALA